MAAQRILPVLVVAASAAAVAWSQVRIGPEFQVNTVTTGHQKRPEVGIDAAGGFVVVWNVYGDIVAPSGVFGRRFDATGTPLDDDFVINAPTGREERQRPSLAVGADGTFVVAWREHASYADPAPHPNDIVARPYDASGTPGEPFVVDSITTHRRDHPAVALGPAGDFTVVWSDWPPGEESRIRGQRFDAAAVPQGPAFTVSSATTSSFHTAAVTDAAGNLLVTWADASDGHGSGVMSRRYDPSGSPLGPPARVNTYTTYSQTVPAIAAGPDGGFVVAWQSYLQDGALDGIFAQRFDASGVPRGGEFMANTYTTNDQYHPAVAFDAKGNFVVAWTSKYQSVGGWYSVWARLYDAAGMPHGGEFRVNAGAPAQDAYPSVGFDPDGNFLVVWQAFDYSASSYEIRGQRFAPDLIFRDGFESGALSAWSSSTTDSGDLASSGAAALKGTSIGLQGTIDDTTGLYVEDDSPRAEGRYRARFYLDPSGFDPGEAAGHFRTRTFVAFESNPSRRVAAVVLKRRAGQYSLMARARLDDNSQADTAFYDVAAGAHVVEIELVRASAAGANDGALRLWLDGTLVATLAALDNDQSAVDFARLGALSVKSGASGTIRWDEFESRRLSYIGP